MSTCPNCRHRIGVKPLLQATSLSGTVCPRCGTSLRPEYWSSALLMLLSLAAGLFVGNFVRDVGPGFPAGLLSLLGAFAVVYLGLAPVLLRYRVKGKTASLLGR